MTEPVTIAAIIGATAIGIASVLTGELGLAGSALVAIAAALPGPRKSS